MSPLGSEEIAGLGLEQVARDVLVAIAVIDAAGQVIYSNGRARELTSRQLGSELPADLDRAIDILHPDGRRAGTVGDARGTCRGHPGANANGQ
jgi:PAS domain-containing protein